MGISDQQTLQHCLVQCLQVSLQLLAVHLQHLGRLQRAVHGTISGSSSHFGARYIQALLSLVQLLHYCALIGRELHTDAIKNQLKATKAKAHSLPFAGSL